LQAVKQPAEILGPGPLDSCILGVGVVAMAVDDFIDTIGRTSISGGSPERTLRVSPGSSTRSESLGLIR